MDYNMLPGRVVASLTGLGAAKIKKLAVGFSVSWGEITGKKKPKKARPAVYLQPSADLDLYADFS